MSRPPCRKEPGVINGSQCRGDKPYTQTLVTQAPSVCREPYIPTASSLPEGALVTVVSVYLNIEVCAYREFHLSVSSERLCQ